MVPALYFLHLSCMTVKRLCIPVFISQFHFESGWICCGWMRWNPKLGLSLNCFAIQFFWQRPIEDWKLSTSISYCGWHDIPLCMKNDLLYIQRFSSVSVNRIPNCYVIAPKNMKIGDHETELQAIFPVNHTGTPSGDSKSSMIVNRFPLKSFNSMHKRSYSV